MNPVIDVLALAKRMRFVLLLLAAAIVVGTYGYHLIEGWPMFDGLYMTVITLGTVGYGETHELTFKGRLFTIFLILGGVSVVTYAFTTVTSIIVEGQLSEVLKRRRMEKEIAKLTGHYIVCGAGHAGMVIIEELRKTARPFVVVDTEKGVLQRLVDMDCLVVAGDATDDASLTAAGVERAAGVFAVLSTDQNNAFVALSAKGLNPHVRVVSAQKELGVREKLVRSGADNVVNPEFIGGLRMASEMIRPAATGFLDSMIRDTGSVIRFDEVRIPDGSRLIGRTVSEVKGVKGKDPLLVAILDQKTGKYDINPDPTRIIREADRLVMIGDVAGLADLRKQVERA